MGRWASLYHKGPTQAHNRQRRNPALWAGGDPEIPQTADERSIQSILASASFTIEAHFCVCSARKFLKSSGVPSLAMAENLARLSCAACDFSPSLIAAL